MSGWNTTTLGLKGPNQKLERYVKSFTCRCRKPRNSSFNPVIYIGTHKIKININICMHHTFSSNLLTESKEAAHRWWKPLNIWKITDKKPPITYPQNNSGVSLHVTSNLSIILLCLFLSHLIYDNYTITHWKNSMLKPLMPATPKWSYERHYSPGANLKNPLIWGFWFAPPPSSNTHLVCNCRVWGWYIGDIPRPDVR